MSPESLYEVPSPSQRFYTLEQLELKGQEEPDTHAQTHLPVSRSRVGAAATISGLVNPKLPAPGRNSRMCSSNFELICEWPFPQPPAKISRLIAPENSFCDAAGVGLFIK